MINAFGYLKNCYGMILHKCCSENLNVSMITGIYVFKRSRLNTENNLNEMVPFFIGMHNKRIQQVSIF
jgi:hypothetical protein